MSYPKQVIVCLNSFNLFARLLKLAPNIVNSSTECDVGFVAGLEMGIVVGEGSLAVDSFVEVVTFVAEIADNHSCHHLIIQF